MITSGGDGRNALCDGASDPRLPRCEAMGHQARDRGRDVRAQRRLHHHEQARGWPENTAAGGQLGRGLICTPRWVREVGYRSRRILIHLYNRSAFSLATNLCVHLRIGVTIVLSNRALNARFGVARQVIVSFRLAEHQRSRPCRPAARRGPNPAPGPCAASPSI